MFVTNNSASSRAQYVEKLNKMGFNATKVHTPHLKRETSIALFSDVRFQSSAGGSVGVIVCCRHLHRSAHAPCDFHASPLMTAIVWHVSAAGLDSTVFDKKSQSVFIIGDVGIGLEMVSSLPPLLPHAVSPLNCAQKEAGISVVEARTTLGGRHSTQLELASLKPDPKVCSSCDFCSFLSFYTSPFAEWCGAAIQMSSDWGSGCGY